MQKSNKIKIISSFAACLVMFLFSGSALASNHTAFLQPADAYKIDNIGIHIEEYNSYMDTNVAWHYQDTAHLTSMHIDGVTYFNGTLVNNSGEGIPITIGDDLRVDGVIFRDKIGTAEDNRPVLFADAVAPAQNNAYYLGSSSNRWSEVWTYNLQGDNIVHENNLAVNNSPSANYALVSNGNNELVWVDIASHDSLSHLSCTGGESIVWNGTDWVCGSGTSTNYWARSGANLSPAISGDDLLLNTGENLIVGGISIDQFLDEDDMVSDSDTALATQQSIKSYVDSHVGTSIWDADMDTGISVEAAPDDDTIRFDTNSNERMIVSSDGKLSFGQIDGRAGTRLFNILGGDTLGESASLLLDGDDGAMGGYDAHLILNGDELGGGDSSLYFQTNGNNRGIITGTSLGLEVHAPNHGLLYASDYSASYTNRSLVDKEYVDIQVTSASPWTRDIGNGYIYPKTLTDSIGIGTNTPVAGSALSVYRSDGPNILSIMSEGGSGDVGLSMYEGATRVATIHHDAGDLRLLNLSANSLRLGNSGNTQMIINPSGNVGIGTDSDDITARLEITPSTANAIRIKPYGTNSGETGAMQYMELVANGTNYTGFKAPDNIANDAIWTLPSADGSNGQALQTDGAGTLSWGNVSSLIDSNGDTRVQVEESAGEDIIRFDTAGVERMVIDGYNTYLGTEGENYFNIVSHGNSGDPGYLQFMEIDHTVLKAIGSGGDVSDLEVVTYNDTGISFMTHGSRRMRIDNSGNLGVGSFLGATAINAELEILPDNTDALRINPFGVNAGETGAMQYMELVANGTNYVGFKAPDDIANNMVWALPNADGSNGQVLQTNGAGTLSWAAGSGSPAGNDGAIQYNNGGFFGGDDSNFFWDDSSNRLGIGTNLPGTSLEVAGSVTIADYLYHQGDSNTYAYFTPDRWQLYTGGRSMIDAQSSANEVAINEGSTQTDFRVEGGSDANLLFTDGSADNVGIGTNTPDYKLQVNGTVAPEATDQDLGTSSLKWDAYLNDVEVDEMTVSDLFNAPSSSAPPASPQGGTIYYDTDDHTLYVYDAGTSTWDALN